MQQEGKYIYCIINTSQDRHFGPIGIGGRGDEVSTVGIDELAMVVSNHPLTKLVVNRENMLSHERVIEEVMTEYTVLPVRFCTIASSTDEIRNLLFKRYREFMMLLRDMDHKVELSVKGFWKDMNQVYREITTRHSDIKKLKRQVKHLQGADEVEMKVEIGKLVRDALKEKKDEEAERVIRVLRPAAFDYKMNDTAGDEMFMNAAFLVGAGRDKEFDNIMGELGERERERAGYRYVGPLPPYNFVNLTIYPEEWER
jgi:hypothetical protein